MVWYVEWVMRVKWNGFGQPAEDDVGSIIKASGATLSEARIMAFTEAYLTNTMRDCHEMDPALRSWIRCVDVSGIHDPDVDLRATGLKDELKGRPEMLEHVAAELMRFWHGKIEAPLRQTEYEATPEEHEERELQETIKKAQNELERLKKKKRKSN
jgi:hypothetical protein